MISRFLHSAVSILFFGVAFFGVAYMVGTFSYAAPTVELGVDGQLLNQYGGSASIAGSSATLEWNIQDVNNCTLENVDTGTTIDTFSYTPSSTASGVSASYTVLAPTSSGVITTVTYRLACITGSGIFGSLVDDEVTVEYQAVAVTGSPNVSPSVLSTGNPATTATTYTTHSAHSQNITSVPINSSVSSISATQTPANVNQYLQLNPNVLPTLTTAQGCISIDDFDLDQDDVYEDERDDDIELSWRTSGSCAYSCELGTDGDFVSVADDDNDYDVRNVDEDLDFELRCTETVSGLSVSAFQDVDFHRRSRTSSYVGGSSSSSSGTPTVVTYTAQGVTNTTVTMRGFYNNGSCSNLETAFQFGMNPNALSRIGSWHRRSGSGVHQTTLGSLQAGTTYYYRLIGQGCGGTLFGDIMMFRTTGTTIISTGTTTVPRPTVATTTSQPAAAPDLTETSSTFDSSMFAGLGYTPAQDGRQGGPSLGVWILVVIMVFVIFAAARFFSDAFSRSHHPRQY